jgi:arginyl-tRNA synthetase
VALREAHKKHYHAELQPYFSSIPREKADQLVEKLLIRILRSDADLALLQEKRELDLMAKISEYPIMLTTATTGLAPHDVTFYLRELSGMIHAYYATTRIVNDKNPSLTTARLALLCAAKQIIANGLKVLGIKPKRTM